MSLDLLARVLAQTTGLDVETLGRGGLSAALQGRVDPADAAALAAFTESVAGDAETRGRLLADLLVHETSFFRYPGSFAYLAGEVRRRLAGGAGGVRILSAPCSTGQEPATVVMALHEMGLDAARVSVDAVDVSAAVVERARRGVYGSAEVRSLSEDRRRRFLRATPQGLTLTPEVLAPIRYVQGDLLDPTFGLGAPPYDIILCRNLLIYLTSEARERLVRALCRLLAPEGVLMVGHAEVAPVRALGLVPTGVPEAYAAVPAAAAPPKALELPPPPPAATRLPMTAPRHAPSVRARSRASTSRSPGASPTPAVESALVLARRLGQEGRAEEALALLARVEGERTPSPDELHLAAVLARALGRAAEVDRSLTRALYLDPRHVPTLRLAALVADEHGERETARRLEARAQRAAMAEVEPA